MLIAAFIAIFIAIFITVLVSVFITVVLTFFSAVCKKLCSPLSIYKHYLQVDLAFRQDWQNLNSIILFMKQSLSRISICCRVTCTMNFSNLTPILQII